MANVGQLLARGLGWAGDSLRLPWALLYWNTRKSIFRWRRGRGRCPCQHPSDSGRAMETACDAAILWNDPARFRFVCPRLVAKGNGHCCSVQTSDVRPFWGRALLFALAAIVPIYVGAATATFLTLRSLGSRQLAWLDVAWPQRWPNIARARSQYFCAEAIAALEQRDVMRARVSLASALEVDHENYRAALLFAMLQSLGPDSPAIDSAFQWLIDRYPDEAMRSAVVFHDILLANGRPDRLAAFSAWMARRDPENTAMWVRALLVALRANGHAAEFAQAHARELATLPPPARSLIAMEILWQSGRAATVRPAIQRPIDFRASPIYAVLQVEQLVRMHEVAAAQIVKGGAASELGPFLALALQYGLEQAQGNHAFAQTCFRRALEGDFDRSHTDWLIALLIRAPNVECFRALEARLEPAVPESEFASVASGLWLAALANGDPAAAGRWAERLRTRAHVTVPGPKDFSFDGLSAATPRSLTPVLNALPLPRETVYALYAQLESTSGASIIKVTTALP